jgi:dienelactone hydrolase
MRFPACLPALLLLAPLASAAEEAPPPETGRVRFTPLDDQGDVPERYRLEARTFEYEMRHRFDLPASGVRVYRVTFPSAVESPHKENNTVHAEYYRPVGDGPFPAIIVLDITGGDQRLSRSLSSHLAQRGIACLFVQMAYYGPRRPPGSNLRLLSTDLNHTFAAIRQTVLDLRLAAAWLEARREVDGKRLGILGTSLGSFMAALTAECEPRLGRVALLLGGGGLVDGYWDHPQVAPYRKTYEQLGGSKEAIKKILAPVDPLTKADNLKKRRLLMLAGRKDQVVPPRMAQALWEASGRQKIYWYDCGHYDAVVHIVEALDHVTQHFTEP